MLYTVLQQVWSTVVNYGIGWETHMPRPHDDRNHCRCRYLPSPGRWPRPESTHSIARSNANSNTPWTAGFTSEDVPPHTSLQ